METGLNLLCGGIALASLGLWYGRLFHQQRRGWQSAIILACVLAILCPVISISDDLHVDPALIADSSPSQQILKRLTLNHGSSSAQTFCFNPLARFSGAPTSSTTPILGLVAGIELIVASPFVLSSGASRAPPSFFN